MVDLGGRTLLPGFVDAHSHVSLIGFQAGAANLLPPPDGPVDDIAALRRELEAWTASESGGRWEWIVGFGYDDAQSAGREHPTRDDLDEVSRDRPVLVIHQSSHLGAVNSKALELLGFDADSPDPQGGVIRRRPGSTEPNGVLEEAAFFHAWGLSAKDFDDEERIRLVLLGQRAMAAYGFTTAQDGRVMSLKDLEVLESAAAQGLLDIDVVAYPDVSLAEHLKDAEVSVPPGDTARRGQGRSRASGCSGPSRRAGRSTYDSPEPPYKQDQLVIVTQGRPTLESPRKPSAQSRVPGGKWRWGYAWSR
ncbi:amidohydrolase family protein [Streptomyces sp. TLI_146]|uniref:amidohydrolase family protein n=1 Tax=Streptomyces sp. TLI_146 TaxID=1938858 RepID=UPI000C714851|nr:amidohydrolase family protein [Streptomyces sp. TLI_146]PKV89494.1 amidohydrolase family protein [Streptomyces sp. TLI_146]